MEYTDRLGVSRLNKFTELRAFDKDGELVVRCFGGEYRGRIRKDNAGENIEYLDEDHLLWGDEKKNKPLRDGYTFLSEDRGTQLTVPFDVPVGKHGFIKIRNYLSNDESTFKFDDWRMVEFFAKEAEEEDENHA